MSVTPNDRATLSPEQLAQFPKLGWRHRFAAWRHRKLVEPYRGWTKTVLLIGTATRCCQCGAVLYGQRLGCSCMPIDTLASLTVAGTRCVDYGLLGIDYSAPRKQWGQARFFSIKEVLELFQAGRRLLVEDGDHPSRMRDWPAAWPNH